MSKKLIFILIPLLKKSHTVNDFKCNNVSYMIHELER